MGKVALGIASLNGFGQFRRWSVINIAQLQAKGGISFIHVPCMLARRH
jgi:hypothetical protein